MVCPRLSNPGYWVLLMIIGGVATMTCACGSENISSGPGLSGSGAANLSIGTSGSMLSDGAGGTLAVMPGSGGSTPIGNTAATSPGCPVGTERCACYGNSTCNAGLLCASQLCVNVSGLLGTGGVASLNGNGGTKSVASATGGSVSPSSSGGASASGSITTGGTRATGGAPATGGVSFWKTVAYSSTGLPNPSNGNHNPGQNCIQCHISGSSTGAPVWIFGGTVYQSNGTTPAPNVQVGVNDGTNLYTAYSATNGNFWVSSTGTINWSTAQVRVRNANGELTMSGATPAAACNMCHNSTIYPRITAP